MGFLKNLAAKGLGSVIGDDLADALIPDDLEKRIAKKAAKKAGEAAVDAAVGAAVGASVNALTNRKSNSLRTPPPPPSLPNMKQTIRVMVAVNGQQYGPYEEAGLRNMIDNGSLTKDTYVFVEGDSAWRFAKDVAQVNRLFGASAIPAPPVPFAPAPPAPGAGQPSQSAPGADGLSAKMNSLIDAAVADGEISDLERQVLIRNAQAEGVAMDEFVVVLEARLYEQRKKLQAEQEALNNQKKHADAAVAGASRAQRPEKKNEVRKCPACGEIILEASARVCKQCGYEFDSVGNRMNVPPATAPTMHSIHQLLEKVDIAENAERVRKGSKFDDDEDWIIFSEQRDRVIKTYPIPSNKADFIDFLILCANNAKYDDSWQKEAWKLKRNEAIDRADVVFKDDADVMAVVEKYRPRKKKFGIF